VDIYNFNKGIGNDQPAGIPVGALPVTRSLTELTAIGKQLDYIDRNLANPGSLTPVQIQQIEYYKVHVQNYRATIVGAPTIPMPPLPPGG